MKEIWKHLKQHKKLLFFALFLATINQGFSLLDPQIFRLIVDKYATRASQMPQSEFVGGVLLLLLGAVGVALISRIAKNFQDYYVNAVSQRVGYILYSKGVAHSFSLPYKFFEEQRSGEILESLQKAKTDIQTFIAGAVNVIFFSLVGILIVLIYAWIVHWAIGLAYLSIIPVLGITTFFLSGKIKTAQKEIVKEQVNLSGSTTETLRNIELVKSLGLENQEVGRLNTANENILKAELKKIRLIRKFSFTQGTLINALRSSLLFLLLFLIWQGFVSLGEFFTLFIYSFLIFGPLSEVGTVATQYQEARASNEKLNEILKLKPEEKPKKPKIPQPLKEIAFQKLFFGYSAFRGSMLKNVNLTIEKGKTVAFVGPSGSGKSTLVKLIVGLYKPTRGKLLFNDIDSREVDFEKFRKRIGLVTQETQLFAGTIRENLMFANPEAADQDCLRTLKQASVQNILRKGNKGLDTKIGEGGVKLSGGERQRLAIARALLRNPDLLIFDEATSNLDSITEKEITRTIKGIEKLKPDLITILVAHRLSTIQHADLIYVLKRGRIVEKGGHYDLIKKKGLYAALWQEQSANNNDNKRES